MGMNAVPAGWLWCELGDLLLPVGTTATEELSDSVTYIDISSIDRALKQVRNPRTVSRAELPSRARHVLRPGDVLFGLVRPYLQSIAEAPSLTDMVASSAISVLRPIKHVSSRYIFYLVQSDSFLAGLLPLQRGTSYPAVTDSDVKAQKVLLPPADEQIRLERELDIRLERLDTEIKAAKATQESCVIRTQALYDTALSLPRSVSGASGRQHKSGWREESLGALLTSASYGTSARTSDSGQGSPVLRIPNVRRGEIRFAPLHYTSGPLTVPEGEQLRIGDILVVRSNGSVGLVGVAAAVRDLPADDIHFASYLIRLRVDATKVSPAWVEACFASTAARQWIERRSTGTTTQHNVNLKTIRSMTVPVPPLSQQDGILKELDSGLRALDSEWKSAQDVIDRADQTRKRLLHQALAGALVPPGPGGISAPRILEAGQLERASAAELEGRKRGAGRVKRQLTKQTKQSAIESLLSPNWQTGQAAYTAWLGSREHSITLVEQFFRELDEALVSGRLQSRVVRDGAGMKVGDEFRLSGARDARREA